MFEPFLEDLASSIDAGFHRFGAAMRELRDLGVAQALVNEQRERFPQLQWERNDGGVHRGGLFMGESGLAGSGIRVHGIVKGSRAIWMSAIQGNGGMPGFPTGVVAREVSRDGEEPRAEVALRTVAAACLIEFYECLLRQVDGGFALTGHPKEEGHDAVAPAVHQGVERQIVAGGETRHEVGIRGIDDSFHERPSVTMRAIVFAAAGGAKRGGKHGFQIAGGLPVIEQGGSLIEMLQHPLLAFGMDACVVVNGLREFGRHAAGVAGEGIKLRLGFGNPAAHFHTCRPVGGVQFAGFGELIVGQFQFAAQPRQFRHGVEQRFTAVRLLVAARGVKRGDSRHQRQHQDQQTFFHQRFW